MRTHPDDGIQLGHGHLLGPVDRRGDLLLVLLREERQDLRDYGVQSLRYLRLKQKIKRLKKRLVDEIRGIVSAVSAFLPPPRGKLLTTRERERERESRQQ